MSASQIEYDFVRRLAEQKLVPPGVKIQVLVLCKEDLIARTFEAVAGLQDVIIHVFNSTSTLQRDVVFHMTQEEVKQLAVSGASITRRYAQKHQEQCGGYVTLEYSPESFSGTETEYALEVCNAVIEEWQPTESEPMIINLPETVQLNMPNIYADQVEFIHRNLCQRAHVILSVHTHNDRGTGVASAVLAFLAGATRVEIGRASYRDSETSTVYISVDEVSLMNR